jgi:hypothetical protein
VPGEAGVEIVGQQLLRILADHAKANLGHANKSLKEEFCIFREERTNVYDKHKSRIRRFRQGAFQE